MTTSLMYVLDCILSALVYLCIIALSLALALAFIVADIGLQSDYLDVVNMYLSALFLGVTATLLSPLVIQTHTRLSSAKVELHGTALVTMLIVGLNI